MELKNETDLTLHGHRIDMDMLRTQLLMDQARDEDFMNPFRHGITKAFKTYWASALTVERVKQFVDADMHGSNVRPSGLQDELTRMARQGYLRSRRRAGRRLYEVNYDKAIKPAKEA